jgi:hypothetical protein
MPEHPLLQDMRSMIASAQADYDRIIQVELSHARMLAHSLRGAIGEVSPAQALSAWKRELVKRFTSNAGDVQ